MPTKQKRGETDPRTHANLRDGCRGAGRAHQGEKGRLVRTVGYLPKKKKERQKSVLTPQDTHTL